jgi:hypothetical protein
MNFSTPLRSTTAFKILLFVTGFAILSLPPHVQYTGPDTWGNVFLGEWILEQGSIPDADVFSYTAFGEPWINHEWAAQLMMYGFFRAGGAFGLIVWRLIVVVAMVAWIIAIASSRSSRPLTRAAVVLASLPLISVGMSYRPVLLSLPLFLGYAVMLDKGRRVDARWFWACAPLMWLWANLHGSFAVGLALHAIAAVCAALALLKDSSATRPLGHLVGSLAACFAVTFINLHGVELWTTLWRHIGGEHEITEWKPIVSLMGQRSGEIAILLGAVAAMIFSQRPKSLTAMSQLGAMIFLPFMSVRHLPLAGMLIPLFLTEHIDDCLDRFVLGSEGPEEKTGGPKDRRLALVLYFACVGLLLIFAPTKYESIHVIRADESDNPLPAIAGLKRCGVEGNLLVFYNWAHPVLYHCRNDVKVAFGGRERTVYPPEVEAAYVSFHYNRGDWDKLLDGFDQPTQWILFPSKAQVLDRVRKLPNWGLVAEGETWSLFGRDYSGKVEKVDAKRLSDGDYDVEFFPGRFPESELP